MLTNRIKDELLRKTKFKRNFEQDVGWHCDGTIQGFSMRKFRHKSFWDPTHFDGHSRIKKKDMGNECRYEIQCRDWQPEITRIGDKKFFELSECGSAFSVTLPNYGRIRDRQKVTLISKLLSRKQVFLVASVVVLSCSRTPTFFTTRIESKPTLPIKWKRLSMT